jgi:hypothetical protein
MTGRHLSNRVRRQQIQSCKNAIEDEVNAENEGGERRPAQSQDRVIGVAPIEFLRIDFNELEMPGPDFDVARLSLHGRNKAACGIGCLSARIYPSSRKMIKRSVDDKPLIVRVM